MVGEYAKYPVYPKGTIVNLRDIIDLTDGTICTIKAIEQDEEDPSLKFYFLYANNEDKNDKFDPIVGRYFEYVEHCSPRLIVLSKPTAY